MKFNRFFSIVAIAIASVALLSSCNKTDPEDIENEDYLIIYGCNTFENTPYNDLPKEKKEAMQIFIDYYDSYLNNIPNIVGIDKCVFRIKGKTLTPASNQVKDVCEEAEKNLMVILGENINKIDFAFSFLVVSEASSGRLTPIYEKVFGEKYITQ